jgi:hypothetical protein
MVAKTTIVQKAASRLPDLEWRRKGCGTYVILTTDYEQNMETHYLSLWISNDSHLNFQECNKLFGPHSSCCISGRLGDHDLSVYNFIEIRLLALAARGHCVQFEILAVDRYS